MPLVAASTSDDAVGVLVEIAANESGQHDLVTLGLDDLPDHLTHEGRIIRNQYSCHVHSPETIAT